jgi:hypothetical protein
MLKLQRFCDKTASYSVKQKISYSYILEEASSNGLIQIFFPWSIYIGEKTAITIGGNYEEGRGKGENGREQGRKGNRKHLSGK